MGFFGLCGISVSTDKRMKPRGTVLAPGQRCPLPALQQHNTKQKLKNKKAPFLQYMILACSAPGVVGNEKPAPLPLGPWPRVHGLEKAAKAGFQPLFNLLVRNLGWNTAFIAA